MFKLNYSEKQSLAAHRGSGNHFYSQKELSRFCHCFWQDFKDPASMTNTQPWTPEAVVASKVHFILCPQWFMKKTLRLKNDTVERQWLEH